MSKVITFAEVTARAEKLKQEEEAAKKIQEAEKFKSTCFKTLIEHLEKTQFTTETTWLLFHLFNFSNAYRTLAELKTNLNHKQKEVTK